MNMNPQPTRGARRHPQSALLKKDCTSLCWKIFELCCHSFSQIQTQHGKLHDIITVAVIYRQILDQILSIHLTPQHQDFIMGRKQPKVEELTLSKKEQKKVDKLSAQIPYHQGRGNMEEVTKIKGQIDSIWEKAKEAQFA
mmetsp:Transcript_20052/g.30390  ORF Transcript_20052/g.30390 Transcript_20052/m.30390 type:complete len:140 (+) Transcript_20052:75-494(+)